MTASEIRSYAEDVIAWANQHVAPALNYLTTNQTAVGIEKALPYGPKIIAALGGAAKALAFASSPAVGGLFAAYAEYQAIGGKPADQAWFDAHDRPND